MTIEVLRRHPFLFAAKGGEDENLRNFRKLTTFHLSLERVSSEKHQQFSTNSHLCRKYVLYLFGGGSRMLYV